MNNTYILLHNFESGYEKKKAQSFLEILPDCKILKYGIIGIDNDCEKDNKMDSLWVRKEHFMFAWAYFNHKYLQNLELTYQDGLDYFNLNMSNENYVKEII